MRKIKFQELKLKDTEDVTTFYQSYLQTYEHPIKEEVFEFPTKQYEICYCDIFNGTLLLLNQNYIEKENTTNQELFFDYSIALTIYRLMLDIQDSILDEKNEWNELYKKERIAKEEEIQKWKQKDEILFKKALEEYQIISRSFIYRHYLLLLEENQKLKEENRLLLEKSNVSMMIPNSHPSFFHYIQNKISNLIRRKK